MADMRYESRMSDSDALMWTIEKDALLRSTITAIAVLDTAPDHDRLRRLLDRGSRSVPRLRQRVRANPLSIAPPRWETDPHFDLDYHVRFVRATGDGDLRAVLDMAQPIAMAGFDRARPLWEATLIEGMEDGRAALVMKVVPGIEVFGGIVLNNAVGGINPNRIKQEMPFLGVLLKKNEDLDTLLNQLHGKAQNRGGQQVNNLNRYYR